MQLNRCPICHTRISLDALAQDEAGSALLGLLAKLDTDAGAALVGYLGLFRSNTRDLANDRALKLAREVLSLGATGNVSQAMRQTIEQIQAKGGKPLSNHNYLKRVLEDVGIVGADLSAQTTAPEVKRANQFAPTKTSKTAQALQALEDFKHGR
jgi:hypothetical protein